MKKIILISLLLLPILCTAQRITYNDLKYAFNHTVEDTENYLSSKGFSFGGIDTLDNEKKAYSYSFTKNSYESSNYISVSKKEINNVFVSSSLYTNKQGEYLKIKQFIKSIGYKLISSKIIDINGIIYKYQFGVNEIDFWVVRRHNTETTEYYITLTNTSLEEIQFNSINSN